MTAGLLSISEREGTIVLEGEIDLATAPQLLDAVEPHFDTDADLLVDMSGVTFIDSSGLGALMAMAKRCRAAGGEIRFTAWPAMFQKMIEITGLTSFFRLDEG